MKDKPLWEFVRRCLEKQIPVMLMTVAESHGASPGRAGFKMAVAANGELQGTIGGGAMEVNWVERSRKQIEDRMTGSSVRKLFHTRETSHEKSGLICSGSQTVLLHPLYPESVATVQSIVNSFEERKSGLMKILPNEITFHAGQRNEIDSTFVFVNEQDWRYEENVGVLDTVLVVGSGHVGHALTRILSTLDFRVIVVDDRLDVPTFVNNTFAHEKHHSSYNEIGDLLSGNGREYVAVVTTAYKSDEAALGAVLRKNVRYIGLMGSAAKTEQIYQDLRGKGFAETQLKRIRAPIGLPIASHTPEEIAISIAAEIIKTRNQPQE